MPHMPPRVGFSLTSPATDVSQGADDRDARGLLCSSPAGRSDLDGSTSDGEAAEMASARSEASTGFSSPSSSRGASPSAAKAKDASLLASLQECTSPQKKNEIDDEWCVSKGSRKEGLQKVTMVAPTMMKMAANVVGMSALAVGYTAASVGSVAGRGKVVDNGLFQAGFKMWMLTNGVVPTVKYRVLAPAVLERLSAVYGLGQGARLRHTDISLTPIIVCNHVSYMDGPVLASVFKAPKIVAKAGARKMPILGHLMEEMDVVWVDRARSDSRAATLEAIDEHCNHWRPGQRPLLIFPEGTTTNGQGLIDFKRGAFTPGAPVRPVLLVPTSQWDPAAVGYKMTKDGRKETTDAEWGAQFLGHWIHSMHISVQAPYFPNAEERADPDLYARNVRQYMLVKLTSLKAELESNSWKTSAGRESGGLSYQPFDVARVGVQRARTAIQKTREQANSLAAATQAAIASRRQK